ncbi:MAG TPA: cation:proton antiporter [Candidatus Udaeobacter sp.]|nr:cation:proton antiporter [Candidatus Udaeobacter sp.]
MTAAHGASFLFIELGLVVAGLAILARLGSRWGFSAIPLYLLAGLAFGNGGLAPLKLSESFVRIGAEIGVLLLLFMLGLEYTGDELKKSLRLGIAAGVIDFVLNFTPGVAAGLLFRWQPLAAVLLGGITYISSSGVIAKVLTELHRMDKPETPLVLSVLVQEDLAMAVYLPLVAVLLSGGGTARIALSVCVAIAVVSVALLAALRWGPQISRLFAHESDEIILLTTIGAVLLVAGVAQRFQVSAAIGAFLVGIALSGSVAEKSRRLVSPLRDLFAALFFFFFGLEINPAALLPSLPFALGLGAVTTFTKVLTGYVAGRSLGIDPRGRIRAGAALVARGEFSIVIAGLGVAIEPRLGPLSAAYVLLMAIAGPVLARATK